MKCPRLLLLTALVALVGIGVMVGIVQAQTGYTLRYGAFNASSGIVTGTGYQAQVSAGQPAVGASSGEGYQLIGGISQPQLLQQYAVALSPGYNQAADPNTIVNYTHVLTNTGNHTDTILLDVKSQRGWPVTLLGGAYSEGTILLPLRLGAGMTASVEVSLTVPLDVISGTVEATIITATSLADTSIYITVTDLTTVGHRPGLGLAPAYDTIEPPNDAICYAHVLTNTGNAPDTIQVTPDNLLNWPITLQEAPGGGGTIQIPFPIAAGASVPFSVCVTVPLDTAAGVMASTYVTVTSIDNPSLTVMVTDTTTAAIARAVALGPNHTAFAEPDEVKIYTHTLTNMGNITTTFDVIFTTSDGWSTLLTTSPVTLVQGATTTIQIEVAVPSDAISGTVETNIVTATSQLDPTVYATATNTTTVGEVHYNIYLPLTLRNP